MKKIFSLAAAIALALALGSMSVSLAATTDAILGMSPTSGTYTAGQNITLTVSVQNPSAQEISAVKALIAYPSNKLSGVSVNPGSEFQSDALQEPGTGNFFYPAENMIKVSYAKTNGAKITAQSFVLATVTLKVDSTATNDAASLSFNSGSMISVIEGGSPVNILVNPAATASYTLNPGGGGGGGGAGQPGIEPEDIEDIEEPDVPDVPDMPEDVEEPATPPPFPGMPEDIEMPEIGWDEPFVAEQNTTEPTPELVSTLPEAAPAPVLAPATNTNLPMPQTGPATDILFILMPSLAAFFAIKRK